MDVISLHQAGFVNAVASLGTALTSQHASLLKRYTDEVILTYDSDEAGVRAALRAIPLLKEAGISARVLSMEPYKDPDEFIKALGAEEFQKRIDNAQNSFLFETDVLKRSYDMTDPEGKTSFYEAVAKRLVTFEQELERENYIEAVALRYNVSRDSLRKMVNRMALKKEVVIRPAPIRAAKTEKEAGLLKSQKLLLTWLIEYPKLYPSVKAFISPEDFDGEPYKTVANLLFAQYETGEHAPAKIINHFTDPEEQSQAASLFHSSLRVENAAEMEKAFKESLQKMMLHSLDVRKEQLNPTDMAGLQKIITDRRRVNEIARMKVTFE